MHAPERGRAPEAWSDEEGSQPNRQPNQTYVRVPDRSRHCKRATISSGILAPRGDRSMSDLTRRQFVTRTAAAAAAVGIGAPSVHAQKRGGTLRFIPHADLKVLDPIWTTAYITRNHSYMIYDTLFGTDEKLQVKPQMVDKWTATDRGMRWSFTLRDGLKWHDGQPVVAEDAVESVKRWSKRDPLGKLLAAHTAKIAALDRKTFTLELAQPF